VRRGLAFYQGLFYSKVTTMKGTKGRIGSGAANPIRFTGKEMDETGLYYYRARYYSPEMGRFISEDPIGFEGGDVNFYSYVDSVGKVPAIDRNQYFYARNNPINLTDPMGLFPEVPGNKPTNDNPNGLARACEVGPGELRQCIAACKAGGETFLNFCRSLPHPNACWLLGSGFGWRDRLHWLVLLPVWGLNI